MNNKSIAVLSPHGLISDFRLLVLMFITLRITLAMVYQPNVIDRFDETGELVPIERGLTALGDFGYYFQFARLSDEGLLPYRDYWYEFPPVWSTVFIGLYRLLAIRGPVDYSPWATSLGLILVAADVGVLVLLRRLACRLHGEGTGNAMAWAYALLAAPLILTWWTFETLVALAILAALVALVEGRFDRSAGAVVTGALTKYVPLVVLPAVWRFFPWRRALRYTLIVGTLVGLGLGLVFAWGGELGTASITAQYRKASYETVWALIDGNWRTGIFPGPEAHFDPAVASEPLGNPAVIPGPVRLIPFAAIGLWIFTRRLRQDAYGVVAFVSVTIVLFFLWSQGWSPQWVVTLIPLILLSFPMRNGVLICALLTVLAFFEYPVLFMRTGDTDGVISGALVVPYVAIILMRTGLLIGLAVALVQRLRSAGDDAAA